MTTHFRAYYWAACLVLGGAALYQLHACCSVTRLGKQVINADQSVIILWDPEAKRQHFIRQAKFETDAEDIGFLIPSPSQPELEEAGDGAFAFLKDLTAAEIIRIRARGGGGDAGGCGCSAGGPPKVAAAKPAVRVLEEKRVAGFDAVVLEADGTEELTAWLEEHGYAFSLEVAAWAAPYVDQKWKFTALKVAKLEEGEEPSTIVVGALRMSFDTDRPLFPYREPEYKDRPDLATKERLLQIFFLSDAKYAGELTPETPWSGKVAWAGKMSRVARDAILTHLKLPPETGPPELFLTEYEDQWSFRLAPADVYFARSENQDWKERPTIHVSIPPSTDGVALATFGLVMLSPLLLRRRRV